MKIILISVDGMRPDALTDIPEVERLKKSSPYTLSGRTVFPSVTLPCHVSMFLSVPPERHGTTTNTYTPQVRPVPDLCEVLMAAGKTSAFFYDWAELRDLTKPFTLSYSYMAAGRTFGYEKTAGMVTAASLDYINKNQPDFAFIYYCHPDEEGHTYGWMGEEYLSGLRLVWKEIDKVMKNAPDEYSFIITTDHGGHLRGHGSDSDEDMTIPAFFVGDAFKNVDCKDYSILDAAPTIAAALGATAPDVWEGKSLIG